ncbi:glycosyltransferase family A protein [Variovorax sp. KK3]|uniref:glycosyltransferase family A protein n=1 Tax=Variovorax sp. KK3 TaxID=1855728 RepID=UPI00097BB733|nr:glycosyltransferase family A protein [Variovorax sp. KK3]
MPTPLVTIVTAHAGNPLLQRCVESVRNQDYDNIQHLVVADGPATWAHARAVLNAVGKVDNDIDRHRVDLIELPYSIGKDRWNGHRIYGAGTYIADGDYLVFLDDDNSLEPGHVRQCLATCAAGHAWAYSLRNIVDAQHRFLCRDDCESLGKWPSVLHPSDLFIDVNCYFLPKLLAVQVSPLWYRKFREPGQPEVDRVIAHALRQLAPSYDCTYEYSVNYLVGSTPLSVQPDFFIRGNAEMLRRFDGRLPWARDAGAAAG